MRPFKIRCSAIGQIMTNPRSKSETLSQTAKTYCETWLKEQLYGKRNEFSNKYTEKGLICEDESIDFLSDIFDLGLISKNEDYFENDFITGTPDLILNDRIIDVKNSWDCFTFPLFETEATNKNYTYQLQGYMSLVGKDKAQLIYILSNTPLHLIQKEAYYWCKNNGYDELDMDVYKKFVEKMTYTDIDNKLKYKSFDIEKDQSVINSIELRVIECRNYIEILLNKIT